MDVMLWVVGIAASLAIAIWQNGRAKRAERRNDELMERLPRQVISELQKLGHVPPSTAVQPVTEKLVAGVGFSASAADLNGDGLNELLVQFPVGSHGSALQTFGMRGDQFGLLGDLSVGTPEGFWVEDFDADGQFEVGTRETDWSLDLPYVYALREKIYYRLGPSGFAEVGRVKDYGAEEIAAARQRAAQKR